MGMYKTNYRGIPGYVLQKNRWVSTTFVQLNGWARTDLSEQNYTVISVSFVWVYQ